LLAQLARDVATTRASAARGIAIAEEQAFNAWEMMGSVLQGWGLAMEGPSRAGIDQMQRGFDAWCATGARNLRPLFQALLADAWLAAGDAQRALQSAEAGIASASSGERVWVPELHRLRALALLQQGQRDPARHELHAAITLAEQMGARAWRQRAEADLAHVSHGERSSA
jgi:predicted ATPase